jgi:hypothetical protein
MICSFACYVLPSEIEAARIRIAGHALPFERDLIFKCSGP